MVADKDYVAGVGIECDEKQLKEEDPLAIA
jgi:hypothetical protein